MDLSYKTIMSILDDSIKQSICSLLPPTLKYGSILWIYMVREVTPHPSSKSNHSNTKWQHQIKSLKHQMATLKLCQTEGENVEVFTTKILQILDLGENVCSDAHFTLNEQLSTSSVEQFQVKFMA